MITADVSDAFRVAAALGRVPLRVQPRVVSVTRHFGSLLLTQTMRNANTGNHPPGAPHIPGTGPGPNRGSGDYLDTWSLEVIVSALGVSASAGTNAAQARRLEYGFHGVDSLGREYDQQPFPHAGPALDKIGPEWLAALDVAVGQVLP